MSTLDPAEYIRARLKALRPSHTWSETAAHSPQAWQTDLRSHLSDAIGGVLDWERTTSLDARVTETVVLDGYHREAVRFATREGLDACGYLLVPEGTTAPRAAILCLPGHGRGVDTVVGIAEDGTQRPLDGPDEYSADFGLQCVRAGYVAFVLEQISFGCRRDQRARETGPGTSSCPRDSMAALMLGESITGWRVWDAMRALDYLQSRTDVVDGTRLGVMGISGGGLTALFTAALDTRVIAAVISGYLNTFDDSVLAIPHCVDNYAPGLRRLCEMSDIAGLIAPRLLFAENGSTDPIFPVEAFQRVVPRVQEIYSAFGAPTNFGNEIFEGGHLFHGVGAFRFLAERFVP